ncbi:hypothetical protein Tco_1373505 [Tanacetum coccineum]
MSKNKEAMELPLFSFSTIANATASFLEDNKIGGGGFGPVYKRLFDHVRSHLALPTLPIVQVTLASGAASFIDRVSDAQECGK